MAQGNNMMFGDVVIELKQANVSLAKIDDNTNLMNEFLNLSVDTLKQGFGDMLEFFKGNSLAAIEREREQAEFNRDMLAALQDLKPKYAGPDKAAIPKDAEGFGLGGLLAGLAIAIGAVLGVIRGQLQAIKTFAKALMPTEWIDKIRKVFSSFIAGLSMQFDLLKSSMMDKLSKVGKFLTSTFDDVIKFFSGESKLFSGLKNVFTTIFKPFQELFSMAKGLISGPFAAVGDMFSSISGYLSRFGSLVGKVAGIVGKIFLPLTIIMTLWDTVKGAIEGFAKDGIIGGIAGAVKGFFNSLIFGPIDMIKDATAWVLGFFGFDKAKEFLNSFSFEKTFSAIIDAITSPIETLKSLMDGVVNFFSDIGNKISGFFTNFEIPGFSILGKQFGPWKPFSTSTEQQKQQIAPATMAAAAPATTAAAQRTSVREVSAPTTGGAPGVGAVPSAAPAKMVVPKTLNDFAMEQAVAAGRTEPNVADMKVAEARFNAQQIKLSQPGQAGMALSSGTQLQNAAQEKGILQQGAPMGGGGGGGPGGVQQNNSTTVVNNSTVVVKPIPASSRRPNNSEDIFFGRTAGYA